MPAVETPPLAPDTLAEIDAAACEVAMGGYCRSAEARFRLRPGDAWSDVFEAARKVLVTWAEGRKPRPANPDRYLRGLVRNVVRVAARKQRNCGIVGAPPLCRQPADVLDLREGPTPGDLIAMQAAVREAVAKLPGGLREVVELHRLDGLTLDQTAQELGLSVSTVRRREREALDLLRADPTLSEIF